MPISPRNRTEQSPSPVGGPSQNALTCWPSLGALALAVALPLSPLTALAQVSAGSAALEAQRPVLAAIPALPPLRPLPPPGSFALPIQPAAQGFPRLASAISCPTLQQRIQSLVGSESSVWSVTVADPAGRLLADVNGTQPRMPASNQKLLSTAFALDRLGPDFRLNTQLWRLGDGTLRLTGQGDPDFALPQLQRFAKIAASTASDQPLRLQLAEMPPQRWWPQGWPGGDRSAAYGAPITRLALTSNAIDDAVMDPAGRLRALLDRSLSQMGSKAQLSFVDAAAPLPADAVLLHEEPSTSMQGLLSLANTDSHNFTAEVLLRSAAGTWNLDEATRLESNWLRSQGLPMDGVRIYDGSGLTRANRLTSRFITALLLRMDQHPYGRDYIASLSIAGQRGTLRHLYNGTSLDGRLFGKTGTLTGVRAISGVLQTEDGVRYFSAISNGAQTPNRTIGAILRQVQDVSLCSGALSAISQP